MLRRPVGFRTRSCDFTVREIWSVMLSAGFSRNTLVSNMKRIDGWRWRLLAGAAILLVALLPVKSQSAPDWSVCVVDESNSPVTGVLVRESYTNYSAEWEGHEEDQYSDNHGCVWFATKTVRSSPLKRIAVIITSASGGVHSSFGPHAMVTAFSEVRRGDDVRNGHEFAWEGGPSHEDSKLVLRSH